MVILLRHKGISGTGLTQALRISVIATLGSNLKVLFSRNECVSPKEYRVNSRGTDLTLKLEAHPTTKGDFVRGSLSGTVNDGINSRNISLKIVISVDISNAKLTIYSKRVDA
jgi:hypothetical protein